MNFSDIRLIFITVCLLVCDCLAYLTYVSPPGPCSSFSTLGTSIFCCSGECFDGSTISGPGMCAHWDDPCKDPSLAPSCGNVQAMSGIIALAVDTGGVCYSTCLWQNMNYTWSCCNCPQGAVPVSTQCAEPGTVAYQGNCIACTNPDEQVEYDPTNQGYVCVIAATLSASDLVSSSATSTAPSTSPTSQQCIEAINIQNIVNRFSSFSTLLGSICAARVTSHYPAARGLRHLPEHYQSV